jgi:hypothetical protein
MVELEAVEYGRSCELEGAGLELALLFGGNEEEVETRLIAGERDTGEDADEAEAILCDGMGERVSRSREEEEEGWWTGRWLGRVDCWYWLEDESELLRLDGGIHRPSSVG